MAIMAAGLTADLSGLSPACADDFEYQAKLGGGSFGTVYQVQHKRTGKTYAMKTLEREKFEDKNLMEYARAERNVLALARHPFICRLYYAFQTPKQFVLVMQYCPNGDLRLLLKKVKTLPEAVCRLYTAEVLSALVYLHDQRVLYRDLKPENVVLDDGNHAVLTDFGLAKENIGNKSTGSFLGSVCYLAPEVLNKKGHARTVDIYGLGVLTYTMFVRKPPFFDSDRNVMWSNIKQAPLLIPSDVPADAASFIRETMSREPSERLGASSTADAQRHAFLSTIDFAKLERREISVPDLFAGECQDVAPKPAFPLNVPQDALQSQDIFGRVSACSRVFKCLGRAPADHWDYAGGRSALSSILEAESEGRAARPILLGRAPEQAAIKAKLKGGQS